MHKYRTHHCDELRVADINKKVRLSGWVYRKRDHSNLLFIDLKDHYGITQIVFKDEILKEKAKYIKYESVITITGIVIKRSQKNTNTSVNTGEIEIFAEDYNLESESESLPFTINSDQKIPEDLRLQYRFLDLRRDVMHKNIVMRAKIISTIRELMEQQGFIEIQTPILTSSSPEGAKDFLVPSSTNKGKFYALPQAPQQFKQLLMISGFDKYFQIAPCFRDEAARADRSPGEFYQLDIEMSFVTQEDIFNNIEPILFNLFSKFSDKKISSRPFKRIKYEDAINKYGTDKPDLRNPIIITDSTHLFKDTEYTLFNNMIKDGAVVLAIPAPESSNKKSRKFFDDILEFSVSQGAKAFSYLRLSATGEIKGPLAKFIKTHQITEFKKILSISNGDSVFFICDFKDQTLKIAASIRTELGNKLDLINNQEFIFCWITDFPLYQINKDTKKLEFSHNPFSMPQCTIKEFDSIDNTEEILKIKSYQYDIVCNGIELSSGAIRNHNLEFMYKIFNIIGYDQQHVNSIFSGMTKALKYGAPPHGGIAPGIERIVMLLSDAPNIREVTAFSMNQQAEDMLMNAPSEIEEKRLEELNIKVIRD
ncbi:aspartate--tRNA ligase [Rickettsia endosymbiont of Cardiosporidium cionae]|uniref:aspartate--tRNA ligase n=1 Tax=Rickettsia endosymbiont of Cardiosporidium cionae TaxID=2777155 RepID=UPI0018939FC1|nr:aspartate--tRNA ligase [Rickettsia endosymbiont of Cardiosporidium cionae]KAF8818446.1 aspartate--tRNA ligase [Rickettsia endosymbiont of Cardiosporidium cionae]